MYYYVSILILCTEYESTCIAILLLQAETELQKAVSTAAVGSQGLNKQMREFEKAKLTDLKVSVAKYTSKISAKVHLKTVYYFEVIAFNNFSEKNQSQW